MTSDEIRRITERRNEAAAAMDECDLEEAHRGDEHFSPELGAMRYSMSGACALSNFNDWCAKRY